jgi:hypothetical protein
VGYQQEAWQSSQGESVEQQAGSVGFREVDQDGNPAPEASRDGASESSPSTGVNPFIVALWLLAAVLIVGGIAAIFGAAANTMPVNGQVPVSYLVLTFAPYLIVTGVAAVVVLLLWHARQWQQRRAQLPSA